VESLRRGVARPTLVSGPVSSSPAPASREDTLLTGSGGVWPYLSRVLVRGPSMAPLLRDGDCLVVRRGAPVRRGAVVIGQFLDRPGLLVVKRAAARLDGDVWLLTSDNTLASGAAGGPGRVEAVVVGRYWPRPALLRPRSD